MAYKELLQLRNKKKNLTQKTWEKDLQGHLKKEET